MAESKRNIVIPNRAEDERHDLPALVEKLGEDVSKLLDQKATLLRVEIKEEVNTYVRGSVVILAGGIVAAIGFALANIALAFVVSRLFANTGLSQPAQYTLGFVLTGLAYLLIGAVVIVVTKNRLARQGLVPRRTVRELEKDKERFQQEL